MRSESKILVLNSNDSVIHSHGSNNNSNNITNGHNYLQQQQSFENSTTSSTSSKRKYVEVEDGVSNKFSEELPSKKREIIESNESFFSQILNQLPKLPTFNFQQNNILPVTLPKEELNSNTSKQQFHESEENIDRNIKESSNKRGRESSISSSSSSSSKLQMIERPNKYEDHENDEKIDQEEIIGIRKVRKIEDSSSNILPPKNTITEQINLNENSNILSISRELSVNDKKNLMLPLKLPLYETYTQVVHLPQCFDDIPKPQLTQMNSQRPSLKSRHTVRSRYN